jgi:hypothetical protein
MRITAHSLIKVAAPAIPEKLLYTERQPSCSSGSTG